jgi:hypothetical protein
MAITINYPDKVLAGVWQSYTVTSDGGAPDGEVLLDGAPLAKRILPMRPPVWKVTFLLPKDAAGKSLTIRLRDGISQVEESKKVEAG